MNYTFLGHKLERKQDNNSNFYCWAIYTPKMWCELAQDVKETRNKFSAVCTFTYQDSISARSVQFSSRHENEFRMWHDTAEGALEALEREFNNFLDSMLSVRLK